MFDVILERKKSVLANRNKKLRKSKNGIFSTGPWLCSKIRNFLIVFIPGKMGQENWFDVILERKKGFLTIKKNYRNRKIWIFADGLVHGFSQKFKIFPLFLFRAKWPKKTCLTSF